MLFYRAAKLRGEKLFCFSPSYNHYYAVIGNRCADGSVLVDVEKYDLLVE